MAMYGTTNNESESECTHKFKISNQKRDVYDNSGTLSVIFHTFAILNMRCLSVAAGGSRSQLLLCAPLRLWLLLWIHLAVCECVCRTQSGSYTVSIQKHSMPNTFGSPFILRSYKKKYFFLSPYPALSLSLSLGPTVSSVIIFLNVCLCFGRPSTIFRVFGNLWICDGLSAFNAHIYYWITAALPGIERFE